MKVYEAIHRMRELTARRQPFALSYVSLDTDGNIKANGIAAAGETLSFLVLRLFCNFASETWRNKTSRIATNKCRSVANKRRLSVTKQAVLPGQPGDADR